MSLLALLDDGARFDAEYRNGLSNHLPMALLALRRLGADGARLEAFAARYAKRLEPAPAAVAWPAGDGWPERLGEREAWPAYRSLFGEWLAHESADTVLQQALPVLAPGCGAAAFHGLIRTAYAV
ncbi:MAG: questin oxidase family protein, partial [Bacteroidia bacterium]